MSITVTDQPAEVEQLDVDALRKRTMRDLLDLADKFDLPWPRDIKVMRFAYRTEERVSLYLHLDDDQAAAEAAWADALYLTREPDSGGFYDEPYVTRKSRALGALAGFYAVHVETHLYPARGLPEQGPRPVPPLVADAVALGVEAAELVAAALTLDDPALPAEVTDWLADTTAPPRSWSAGEVIDADVDEVTDKAGDTWRRTRDGLWVLHNGATGNTPWPERIVQLHWGPLTERLTAAADGEVSA